MILLKEKEQGFAGGLEPGLVGCQRHINGFQVGVFPVGDVSSSDRFDKCQEDSQAGHNQGDSSTLRMRRRRKDKVQAFAGVLL